MEKSICKQMNSTRITAGIIPGFIKNSFEMIKQNRMLNKYARHFVLVLFTALAARISYAQTPVQVNPQLLPPYSLQVSDYYSGLVPKLQVLLLNRDINQPTIQVKLRMTIESQNCKLRTKDNAVTPTFTLTSGIPYYLTPQDLQSLFAPANLDFLGGYSEQAYTQTGRLPEGLYTFTIEANELYTGNLVSNKGFSLAWLTLADPPFLNTPAKAEGVTPATPQQIVFTWTPRHQASPTAAYLTTYIFSIVEDNSGGTNPEAAFASNPPLYVDSVLTTTYLYDAAKPQLIPGKNYAWRVQAVAKNGAQNLAMFRNNGISEAFWFSYQNNCPVPTGITATVQGIRSTIEWLSNPVYLDYKVEYREKNNPDAQWFTMNNTLPRVMLTDLKPSTQYEYRVGGSCREGVYTYSTLQSFATTGTAVSMVPNCGDSTTFPAGGGTLQTLVAGDTIKAGSFTVNIGYVTGTGSFTGTGYVRVPWLMNAKVEVRFTNITVSSDKKLKTGIVETTYDPTESGIADIDEYIDIFTAGYGVGGVITGSIGADTTLNITIPWPGGFNVTLPPGYNPATGQGPVTISITPQGGGAPVVITANHLPTTIKDAAGNVYQVNKDGTVSQIGKAGGDLLVKSTNKKLIDADKALVEFIDYPTKQVYAFDAWTSIYKKSNTFNKEYERIPVTSFTGTAACIDNNSYYVSAKAIAPGATDYIKAKVSIINPAIKADSVQFVSGKGIIFNKKVIDSNATSKTYEIAVVGGPAKDAQEIYALYPQSGVKTLNLGKLLVASYPRKEYKVNLVPINTSAYSLQKIKDSVNNVYNKINVYVTFNEITGYTNTSWDETKNGLDVKASSFFSVLTNEMKNLNSNYRDSVGVRENEVYLFILQQASDTLVLGDMPRSRQFGYIFTQNDTIVEKVIGHELGHGLFNLKHIKDYSEEMNSALSNVMSYPPKAQLAKAQWDFIFDPALVLNLFNRDESDMYKMVGKADKSNLINEFSVNTYDIDPAAGEEPMYYYFFSGDGKKYKIEKSKISNYNVNYTGELKSFTYNNKTYISCYNHDTKVFVGYYDNVCINTPGIKNADDTYNATKAKESGCYLDLKSNTDFIKLSSEAQDNVKRFNQFLKGKGNVLINNTQTIRDSIRTLLAKLPPIVSIYKQLDEQTVRNDLQKYLDFLRDLVTNLEKDKLELNGLITEYYQQLKTVPDFANFNTESPDFSEPTITKIWDKNEKDIVFRSIMDDSRCKITQFFEKKVGIQSVTHANYGGFAGATQSISLLQSLSLVQKQQVLNIFLQSYELTSTSWNVSGSNCFLANFGEEIVVAMLRYANEQEKLAFLSIFKNNKFIVPRFYKKIDNGHLWLGGGDNFDHFVKELVILTQINASLGETNPNSNTPIVTFNPEKSIGEFELYNWVSFDDDYNMKIRRIKVDALQIANKTLLPPLFSTGNNMFTMEDLGDKIDPLEMVGLVLTKPSPNYFPKLSQNIGDYPITIPLPAIAVAQIVNRKSNAQIELYADVAFTILTAGTMATASNGLQFVWRASQTLVMATAAYLKTDDGKNLVMRYFNNDQAQYDNFMRNFGYLETCVTMGVVGEGVFDIYKSVRGTVYKMETMPNMTQVERDGLTRLESTMKELDDAIVSGNVKNGIVTNTWNFVRNWASNFSNTGCGRWFGNLANSGKIKVKDFGSRIEYYFKGAKYSDEAGDGIKIATLEENAGSYKLTQEPDGIASYEPGDIVAATDDVTGLGAGNFPDGAAVVYKDGKCSIKGGGCFAAGTLIFTTNGKLPIENIKVGDEVLSYDSIAHKNVIEKVSFTYKKAMAYMRKIIIGKDTIIATPGHLIHTAKGWIAASLITAGTLVTNSNSSEIKVDTAFTIEKAQSIYNFEVEHTHNYYVGNTGILVHNGIPCDEALKKAKEAERALWQLDKQILTDGRHSSARLGTNLEKTGTTRPPNTAAHHICAAGSTNTSAIKTREILEKAGINIDEAANGVFLPKSSKYSLGDYEDAVAHTLVHTDIYYKAVYERLRNLPYNKIRDELKLIADELLVGAFPY